MVVGFVGREEVLTAALTTEPEGASLSMPSDIKWHFSMSLAWRGELKTRCRYNFT